MYIHHICIVYVYLSISIHIHIHWQDIQIQICGYTRNQNRGVVRTQFIAIKEEKQNKKRKLK